MYVRLSACLSVCLSVSPHGTIRLRLDGFSLHFSIFGKSVKKIQISLKLDKNHRTFTRRPMYIFDHISLISS
jgi:hypothetical protein